MATAFNRVRVLYLLGGSNTASVDITVAGAAPGGLETSYADLLAYAEAIQAAMTLSTTTGPWDNFWSMLSQYDVVTGVNAQYVQGTVVIASAYAQLGTPEPGITTLRNAVQTALVGSLRTDEAGRSARGRMYFPATGIEIAASGRIEQSDALDYANGMGTLLAQVCADHSDPTAQIQVYSRTEDVIRPVTRLLVDGTPDTQRRRRDKLVSAYQTSTTYPA